MSKFLWSTSRQQFLYTSTGQPVAEDLIRGFVEETVNKAGRNLQRIAQLRKAEKINNAEWVIRSGEELKNMHRSLAMVASGGRQQMTPRSWGEVGAILRREFSYLNRFANELDNIPVNAVLTDEFVRRAGSYANAGYSTYQSGVRAREIRFGGRQERNVLGAADHCEECLEMTARGWVPAGTLTPIGSRICNSGCRCYYQFRNTPQEQELAS